MAVYTYYLHEGRDKVPSFEIALFEDVAPALDHGRQLLRERPRYDFIEVTLDDAAVARLTRDTSTA